MVGPNYIAETRHIRDARAPLKRGGDCYPTGNPLGVTLWSQTRPLKTGLRFKLGVDPRCLTQQENDAFMLFRICSSASMA
jgi:hypothetical protein